MSPPPLLVRLALAALAGMAQAWSLATPWDAQPHGGLQIGAMVLWLWCLQACTQWRHAALVSWIFASSCLASTTWWLYIAMHTYAGLPAVLAALAVGLLSGVLALYTTLAGVIYHALHRRTQCTQVLAFAASWLLAELARAQWFTGFPWGAIGYAHVDSPLAVLAPYLGVYGVSAAAAALAAAVLKLSQLRLPLRQSSVLQGFALCLGLSGFVFHALTTEHTSRNGRFSVSLLQGQIAQEEKFQPLSGIAKALDWYQAQLLASTSDLSVTPETAIPLLPQQLPPGYWDRLQQHFAKGPGVALVGLPLGSHESAYTNSVLGLGRAPTPYRYDKHHLVPFGEFIPPLFRWFTQLMHIPLGDFARGPINPPAMALQDQWLGPTICFEDLFGEDLAQRFTDARQAPTAWVNMSNLGWFGQGMAIDQHLNISRMRTLEFERPMLRATNTGATVVIDHKGRVTAALPRDSRGVLVAEVEGRRGLTPYARWASRFGLWPLWGLGLLVWGSWALRLRWRLQARRSPPLDVHP